MVYIWANDYINNPNNGFYVGLAEDLNMDWKQARDMYDNLHPVVRKELDKYLGKVRHMKNWEYLRHHKELRNRPSQIMPITRQLESAVIS